MRYNGAVIKKIVSFILMFFLGIGCGLLYLSFPSNSSYMVSPLSEIENLIPKKKEVIGFLPYWLLNRAKPSYKNYLTNLSYFSLTINEDGTIQKLINDREEEPGWTTLKKSQVRDALDTAKADGLKTSLVVFNAHEKSINSLLSDPINHANALVSDITPLMQQYKFDDLNLDIESLSEASASSQAQFKDFIQTLKSGLTKNNLGTLTVDMTVMSLFQNQRMNPKDIGEIADKVVLMTYDYHYAGSLLTGAVSPLQGSTIDRYNDVTLSVKKAKEVIPSEKLLLGIPLYGYEWQTLDQSLGSAIIPGTGQTASDSRVEQLLTSCQNCTHGRDMVSDEAYVYFPSGSAFNQIFYTDRIAIQNRMKLVLSERISGAALWALGYEGSDTLDPLLVGGK